MEAIDLIAQLIKENQLVTTNLFNTVLDRNEVVGLLCQWLEVDMPPEQAEQLKKTPGYPRLTPDDVRVFLRDWYFHLAATAPEPANTQSLDEEPSKTGILSRLPFGNKSTVK